MSIPYVISVMSYDRVGIIADVTTAIKTLHGNLDDMSQTVLKGYFTMILLASFPDGTEEDAIRKALHAVKGLSKFEIGVLTYEESKTAAPASKDNQYVITASGSDDKGLVPAITEYLRLKQVNIIDFTSRCENSVYTMMLLVSLSEGTDVGKLKKGLQIAMEPYKLTVGVRHQAIFRKVNEI